LTKRFSVALALGVSTFAGLTVACTRGDHETTAPSTRAKIHHLSAALDTGQVVTPNDKVWNPPTSIAKAQGTFNGTLESTTGKLDWRIDYRGLGKPNSVIVDVHLGKRGQFGALLVRLCGPCQPGQTGVATVEPAYVSDMVSGSSWVTVITEKYSNGVIRGQIRAK
jgi:CHRD domain-containing protein